MEISYQDYKVCCSDTYNACEWLVLVFKGNKNIGMHSVYHRPTKEELTKILWGYVNYAK